MVVIHKVFLRLRLNTEPALSPPAHHGMARMAPATMISSMSGTTPSVTSGETPIPACRDGLECHVDDALRQGFPKTRPAQVRALAFGERAAATSSRSPSA